MGPYYDHNPSGAEAVIDVIIGVAAIGAALTAMGALVFAACTWPLYTVPTFAGCVVAGKTYFVRKRLAARRAREAADEARRQRFARELRGDLPYCGPVNVDADGREVA